MNDRNFWKSLNKPFFTLSPMEDVTDTVFREIILELSESQILNVVFSEFTSTDGLCHPIGCNKVRHRLYVSESEQNLLNKKNIKIVAQIWGNDPEKYRRTIKFITDEMKYDGIDINMGCPVKKIIKHGSCSELIKNPSLAKEIILASKESTNLPISVKTRTGINQHNTAEWMLHLLEVNPAAIILHARTQKMLSESPANWNEIGKAIEIRNSLKSDTLIIGNGDIFSLNDAHEKVKQFGVDGVMIGRGIFKNPWFFNHSISEHSAEERINLLLKHTNLFLKTWGNTKSFSILKKFFKIYITNFDGASEIRALLMNAENYEEVKKILTAKGFVINE